MLGLLSGLPRKNCWTVAEWVGDATSDGMQHLLGRAKWDADAIGDEVRGYVVDHLEDDQAVLSTWSTQASAGTPQRRQPQAADDAVVKAGKFRADSPPPHTRRAHTLTCNEVQRLFITLVDQPVHDVVHRLARSDWLRRHQAQSRTSHYRRQAAART